MQSIDSKIQSRIYGRGKGCVVTPGDFLDRGTISFCNRPGLCGLSAKAALRQRQKGAASRSPLRAGLDRCHSAAGCRTGGEMTG